MYSMISILFDDIDPIDQSLDTIVLGIFHRKGYASISRIYSNYNKKKRKEKKKGK